jgi:cell wall-associated NlpC family hydrolase
MINRDAMKIALIAQFGKPYKFGAKWILATENPSGPVDCSGFSRWGWMRAGAEVPEGSTAQHADSMAIDKKFIRLGDYGFLKTADPNIEHHVGLVISKDFMIEARGLIFNGIEIGSVCIHPLNEWEARPDFLGYFRPKSVVAIEGA